MENELRAKLEAAGWIGESLFSRNRTTGSSANMSFLHGDSLYITRSGACFGRLGEDAFTVPGAGDKAPSKELPLHEALYRACPEAGAVLHTHGFYAALWSCREGLDPLDAVPAYTPYLGMKLGKIMLIPYAPPGSQALFSAFAARADGRRGYLLSHHGALVAGRDLWDAFYALEELEESCRLAWEARGERTIKTLDTLSLQAR